MVGAELVQHLKIDEPQRVDIDLIVVLLVGFEFRGQVQRSPDLLSEVIKDDVIVDGFFEVLIEVIGIDLQQLFRVHRFVIHLLQSGQTLLLKFQILIQVISILLERRPLHVNPVLLLQIDGET